MSTPLLPLSLIVVLSVGVGAAQTSKTPTAAELTGTSWRLVQFQGMDDKTVKPDDPSRYTIEFNADGTLAARIDCNRGRGTWKSTGPSQLELGPMAITRAMLTAASTNSSPS